MEMDLSNDIQCLALVTRAHSLSAWCETWDLRWFDRGVESPVFGPLRAALRVAK